MNEKALKIPHNPFKFVLFVSRPYKLVASLALLSASLASATGSLIPYLFKRIIDSVNAIEGIGPESVPFWAAIYLVFGFASGMLWRASGYAGMRWATGVRATGREVLSEHVVGHSHDFFADRFAGSIASKLGNAGDGAKDMVEDVLWGWLSFFIQLVISIWLVINADVTIGLVFIGWLVFVTPINIFFVKKKIPLGIAAQERETELRARTVDVLGNINAVRNYARNSFELGKIKEMITIRRNAGLRNWMFSENLLTLNTILETVFVSGVILASVHLWNIGSITTGDIILILALIVEIRGHLAFIGQRFNSFADTVSQIREGVKEILEPHDVVDMAGAKELEVSDAKIEFDNVSFRYGKREIFSNLNLEIKPGERVGLVGKSGAGKSTLMKLLTRQHDLDGGAIKIDGQDIARVTQESLHSAVAVVPQEPLLFHRTLKENIMYGKPSASQEEVEASAKHAQAHDFIDSLPQKYETLVGERGVKLSGGERQRVAIARAFLKNARILLLDEATSSLDSESEVLIRKALDELMEGKTVIAIAHRLSTLRAMDRILVMDGGRIVEDGSHEELLEKGGIYAELWNHQAGGFIRE